MIRLFLFAIFVILSMYRVMKRFFAFILLLATVCVVQAQENTVQGDTLVLLENKIWRAKLPDEKQ